MNKNTSDSAVSHFLNEVTDQISYHPLRPSIRQELESHIQDRMEELESKGLSSSDAERQALLGMGDSVVIGMELNEAHKVQKSPQLAFISALLLLIGFILSGFIQWTPEQMANGFLYYIPGGIILIFTVVKGYPLLIKYRKMLAIFVCFLYMAQISLFSLTLYSGMRYSIPGTAYFATLLFVPVITVLLYCSRLNRRRFLTAAFCGAVVWMLFVYSSDLFTTDTAELIFLLSTFGTICFMIHRGILSGRKNYLYSIALAFLVFLGTPLILTASGRANGKAFLFPQSSVHNIWDNTYNALLIQELLSKTPLTNGLDITSEEMMSYGSGAWYFASRDSQNIGINTNDQEFQKKVDTLWEQGYRPRYIHYQVDDVTLWDILPQHYHNDYLIALCIFLFGWIPGLLLISTIGLFYLLLFKYITRIHGHLASSLAFSCGQCLLWQGVLYILGNFGYQYSVFPNLPLISEGRLSIIVNMLLLGLIFSAYRYDQVIEDPGNYKHVTSG